MFEIAIEEIYTISSEITLLIFAILLLIIRPNRVLSSLCALTAIGIAIGFTLRGWNENIFALSNTFFIGSVESYLKDIVFAAGSISIFLVHDDRKIKIHHSEILSLMLIMLCGASLLISSRQFILAWLSFELLSIPAYALVGSIPGRSKSAEGGLKYAVFGAAASASMLYGISLLYGATGSLDFESIRTAFLSAEQNAFNSSLIIASLLLIFIGVMFKLSAAPFHYWAPDAFEAAPSSIAGFISVIPKIAGFGFLIALNRIFGIAEIWQNVLAAGAFLSMTYGNLAALPQKNLQRLLAYSTIAHAGYILVAASLVTVYGVYAVLFYLTVYLFMNLGIFYFAGLSTEHSKISELKGFSARSPFLAFSAAIILFSLTGLPPFGGFTGKLFIVSSALMEKKMFLVGALIINSVISLYYYAGILKAMYFEKSEDEKKLDISPVAQTVLAIIIATIMILGIWWEIAGRTIAGALKL